MLMENHHCGAKVSDIFVADYLPKAACSVHVLFITYEIVYSDVSIYGVLQFQRGTTLTDKIALLYMQYFPRNRQS